MWKKYYYNNEETKYSVSDDGQVRNDETQKILSQSYGQGYLHVGVKIKETWKRMRVHRMVAETFIDNPENKAYVDHIDGHRDNNNVSNLRWATPSENIFYAAENGKMGKKNGRAVVQYNLDGEEMMTFISATEAERETGTANSKIILCCQKKRETANDYQWRYLDDENKNVQKVEKKFITGKRVAKCDEDGNILEIYESFKEAARAVDGTSSAISRVCSGTNIRHKGYKWKLVEDIVQEEI